MKEEPIAEPKQRPVEEAKEEPIAEPKKRPVAEVKEEPIAEPRRPVEEPKEEPVSEPRRPAAEPKEEPMEEPEAPEAWVGTEAPGNYETIAENAEETEAEPVTQFMPEPEPVLEHKRPGRPGNSHMAAVQPATSGEEYIPYNTEEAAGYNTEDSVHVEETENAEQFFEEQERPPVRKLTREERELYAPYIQSHSAREQLVKAIDNISMAACTGNIVITGEEGMNTLTLAKNMIREVQATDRNFSGKVAKISGQGLNQRNVKDTLEQLKNGALIVEKASGIQPQTAAELARFLQQDNKGIIIVLEDTKKGIARLFAENPRLKTSFTAWMNVEALSNDTLASFGMKYARQMEYSIDDLGMLALHKRIEELQTIDHVVTVVEVKNIVDNAIRHASKKSLGHFMDILLAKRYDEEDMIILTEKDFV